MDFIDLHLKMYFLFQKQSTVLITMKIPTHLLEENPKFIMRKIFRKKQINPDKRKSANYFQNEPTFYSPLIKIRPLDNVGEPVS